MSVFFYFLGFFKVNSVFFLHNRVATLVCMFSTTGVQARN